MNNWTLLNDWNVANSTLCEWCEWCEPQMKCNIIKVYYKPWSYAVLILKKMQQCCERQNTHRLSLLHVASSTLLSDSGFALQTESFTGQISSHIIQQHSLFVTYRKSYFSLCFSGHVPGRPGLAGTISPFWILLELRMMEVVVTTGAIRRAKFQSNRHHHQTNPQYFYRPDAFITPNQQCQSTEGKVWLMQN